ncbi:UNVERIFIED_CONTAM: hypothetical protein FKN15_029542 [Acipenser sinensis]
MKQITARQDITRADLRQQKDKINRCNVRIDAMQDKMVVLQDRNRHCNIRLVKLPEGADGDDLIHFLQQKIQHWYLILKSSDVHPFLEFNRAHCIYAGGPRTVIFQRLCYNDRQRLLQAARKSAPVIVQGQKLSFYVDYSAVTAVKRRAFREVRAKFRSQGVDSFFVCPAVLKINHVFHYS